MLVVITNEEPPGWVLDAVVKWRVMGSHLVGHVPTKGRDSRRARCRLQHAERKALMKYLQEG